VAPCVRFDPAAGESAWVSAGGLMSYTDGIDWRMRVPGGAGGAVRRMLAGEKAGLTYVTATRDSARFTVAASQPGRIVEWSLDDDGPVVATRGSFLAAWGADVDIDVTVARRAGAALFGGAGLLLQKLSGRGTVMLHVSGDLDEFRCILAEGEDRDPACRYRSPLGPLYTVVDPASVARRVVRWLVGV